MLILKQIREQVHTACPAAEETIKGGVPHFMHNEAGVKRVLPPRAPLDKGSGRPERRRRPKEKAR